MKKILLIIAVVLCVAVAGTALAATVYYDAANVEGTIGADSYVELSLDGSSTTTEIALVDGNSTIYKIHCGVTTSATNDANGTLTITLTPTTGEGYNLTGVTATLYSNSACTTAVSGKVANGTTSAVSMSVTGISASVDYWVKVTYDATAADTAEKLAKVNGSMGITFVQA